jgi:RNA polymerase sigma-70 factor (ECF subfamily)
LLDINEKYLIKRTQNGDSEAFNPLVRKYDSKIYVYICGRIKSAETAKDLTQETWLKAFRAIHTFRGDAAFSSWVYRIAENICIDFFRKQQNAHAIDPLHIIDECRLVDTCPAPCRYLEQQELRAHLQAAIQHLPSMRKQVFRLYYEEELPIKAIAARLKRSEGTIKSHLRNARLSLQERLTPYLKNLHIPWLE